MAGSTEHPPGDSSEVGQSDVGTVPMLLALAGIAGFLDAFNLTGPTQTFIANQTGNTVLVGVAIADGKSGDVWPPVCSLGGFLAGAALSVLLMTGAAGRSRPARLLLAELVLLVAYTCVVLGSVGAEADLASGAALASLILLSAMAMGIQTVIIRHVRGAGVSTTFNSGMVAEVGHLVGSLVGIRGTGQRTTELRVVIILGAIGTYIGGAVLGALGVDGGTWWLLAPISALIAVLVAVFVRNRVV